MKKIVLSLVVMVVGLINISGQTEPEFAWEPYVFNKVDSTFSISMPCESAYIKAKAAASMYLTGIGKVKSYYYINGLHSTLNVDKNTDIIINTGGVSPQQSIALIKLEMLETKRRWKSGETGVFGATSNEESSVILKYKKFGNSSVIISTNELENGEYCLAITNMMTNSKSTKVYTFSIGNIQNEKTNSTDNNNDGQCLYINSRDNKRCEYNADKNGKYCTAHKYMYNKR